MNIHIIFAIYYNAKLIAYTKVSNCLRHLPKHIARYFHAISLERSRAVVSLLMLNKKESSSQYHIEQTPEEINSMSGNLSHLLIKTAKSYERKIVNHADEKIIYEIYTKALSNLLKEDPHLSNIERKQLLRQS